MFTFHVAICMPAPSCCVAGLRLAAIRHETVRQPRAAGVLRAGVQRLPCVVQFGRKGIAGKIRADLGHHHLLRQRQGLPVDVGATHDPGQWGILAKGQRLPQRMRHFRAARLPIPLPGDNNVASSGQGPENRRQALPRLAAHDDRTAQRGALEMRQVFRKVPRHAPIAANNAVARAGINQTQFSHRCCCGRPSRRSSGAAHPVCFSDVACG